jgi:hypothetical protein
MDGALISLRNNPNETTLISINLHSICITCPPRIKFNLNWEKCQARLTSSGDYETPIIIIRLHNKIDYTHNSVFLPN